MSEARPKTARDAANWAKSVDAAERVRGARGRGEPQRGGAAARRRPIQGFGKMWQKTYQVRIPAERVSAADLVATWKQRFPEFWPEGNRFYAPLTGIEPGDVALLNMTLPGEDEALDRRDGAVRRRGVVHADDAAGPHVRRLDHVQRHPERGRHRRPGAGAHARERPDLRARAHDGRAQAGGHLLAAHAHRRGGPLRPRGRRWRPRSSASTSKRQWSSWRNVWQSSAIRSTLYTLGAPGRGGEAPVMRDRSVV